MAQMRLHITLTRQHTLKQHNLRGGKCGGHALLAWNAWWYFDSTSFPYQLLWWFSLSIFSMFSKCREMRAKKAAKGGVAFRLEKTGFSCFSFLYV
jgi:hypothetical protein